MKNRDAFSAFHPAVLCGYYALVLVFSVFLTHPLCLAASLLGALGYWGSTALMFAVCSVFSFIFNRKYSFQSKAPLLQSAVRFTVVIAVCYLVSFGLSDFLVPWVVDAFAWPISTEWVTRIAMLVAQVIFTGMNYIGQRLWAFKE